MAVELSFDGGDRGDTVTGPAAADAAELVLGTEPDAATRARLFTRSVLDAVPEGLLDDAELVVTELVANASLHGRPPIVVRVTPETAGVRIEVEDAGRNLPIRVRRSSDAMTGRGLSLVSALSSNWGVDPAPRGKVVWAELSGDHSPAVSVPPAMDLDSFLDAWPELDVRSSPRRYTIRLGAVPTELLLAAKAHIDNVVREFSLMRNGAVSPGQELPPAINALIEAVTTDFADARTEIKRQALEADAAGQATTDLELHLPLDAAVAGERYLAALEEADRYARSAHLLTLAPPTSHRVFRRWYLTAIIEQLRELAAGAQPAEAAPFALVLTNELDRIAALEGDYVRLRLLQATTTRLADARQAEEMAAIVVEETVHYLGVESARVFLATDYGTFRSAAWHSPNRVDPDPYQEFSASADLPGAEVARTREPIFMRSLREVYQRFPAVEGYYPSDRALHLFPLLFEDSVLGLLAITFRGGELEDGDQLAFVTALAKALTQALARLR